MEIFDEHGEQLVKAILSMQNAEELKRFLTDLCTIPEIHSMAQRYAVAGFLQQNKSYDEIYNLTGASKATISRVNRALVWGENGYKTALERAESMKQEGDQ